MDALTPRRWLLTLWAGMTVIGLTGCGGVDVVALKDNQIQELRRQSSLQAQSLAASLADVESLTAEKESLVAERTTVVKELDAVNTNLRYANERTEQVVRERDKLREDLMWLEKRRDDLEQSLAKVKSVASSSVGELADLRLKRQEFESDINAAKEREVRLRSENQKYAKELQVAKEELLRERAVVRSLQGDEQAAAQGLRVALQDVERLDQEKNGLLDENAKLKVLERKLRRDIVVLQESGTLTEAQSDETERLAAAASAAAPRGPLGAPPSAVEPQPRRVDTLLSELGTVVEDRYQKALRGEFTGDTFDLAFLGAVVVALLAGAWVSIRFFRTRRLSRHLRVLTTRVSELEQLQVEGPAASVMGSSGARGRVARGSTAGSRSRRPNPRRRSGFSAVISTQSAPSRESSDSSVSSEDVSSPDRDRIFAVLEPSPPSTRQAESSPEDTQPSASPGSGQVIGMGGWKDRVEADEGFDDDLSRTQIIPSLESDVAPDLPLPGVESGAPRALTPKKARDAASDERELLEELKATVHKKFDDLIR